MKIIFLDFDGVLNDASSLAEHWRIHRNNKCVEAKMVAQLNRIIEETGAVCVVSSTWRKFFSLDQLSGILEKRGFTGKLIAKTEDFAMNGCFGETRACRGEEIDSWLKNSKYAINVESFVILDDDSDMEPHMNRLVQTSYYKDPGGLCEEHTDRAIEMLNRKE